MTPGKAVIATYARMEETLAGAGLPRFVSETPLEYLGRVLRDLLHTSAEAVSRLTALFERAKFSPHEIDRGMKLEAIDALSPSGTSYERSRRQLIERRALVRPAMAALLGSIAPRRRDRRAARRLEPGRRGVRAADGRDRRRLPRQGDLGPVRPGHGVAAPGRRCGRRVARRTALPIWRGSSASSRWRRESAYDVHYRLRPIFREIAASRLARSAVELDAESGRAEQLLGPDAWAFVPTPMPQALRPLRSRRAARRDRARHRRIGETGQVSTDTRMSLEEVGRLAGRILDEVERAVVGKREALELVLLGLLADGHVLIEDFPGPREDADRALVRAGRDHASSARIQFTPDLMPADVTGSSIFDQRDRRLRVPAGPDLHEPPARRRDQPRPAEDAGGAARGDAGAAGDDRGRSRDRSARPFLVLATQNPIEYEGTYPLPEAQLDRFLLRIGVGYPSREDEWTVLESRIERREDEVELEPVVDAASLLAMQQAIEQRARRAEHRLLHRRRRRGDAVEPERPGRREPARLARAC